MSLPIPNRLAKVRVLQCVEPSSGSSSKVARTTSATVPSSSQDLRPLPGAIFPTPATIHFYQTVDILLTRASAGAPSSGVNSLSGVFIYRRFHFNPPDMIVGRIADE